MHKWILPLCGPSLRICINSAVFSVEACWETNIIVQQKGINHDKNDSY